jgi:hypothetical protein
MGMLSDITDEIDVKGTILNPEGISKEELDQSYYESWNHHFETKEKPLDLAHKYHRLNELIAYAKNYPIILQKLKDIEETFKESEKYGTSPKTIEKALNFYHEGCVKAQKLNKAFRLGIEAKNVDLK